MKSIIQLGASDLTIRVPNSVGILIKADTGLSSNNFESEGLSKSDKEYKTPDYDKAAKKIEMELKIGASSIELERY